MFRSSYCTNRLSIFDGLRLRSSGNGTSSVVGQWCDDNRPPVCAHAHIPNSRACLPGKESILSTGSSLTLLTEIGESTAVNRLTFSLKYEFVSLAQDGEAAQSSGSSQPSSEAVGRPDQAALVGGGGILASTPTTPTPATTACDRVFRSQAAGGKYKVGGGSVPFGSPANVFLYGRGGRHNLTCTYLFLGGPGERVRLSLQNVSLGNGAAQCRSVHDPELGRYRCDFHGRQSTAGGDKAGRAVYISEVAGEPLSRAQCLCQYLPGATLLSTGSAIKLTFAVPNMDETEDAENIFFRATFQFVGGSNAEEGLGGRCWTSHGRQGGGQLTLEPGGRGGCDAGEAGWARRADANHLLLRLPGLQLPQPYTGSPPCPLRSRLVVSTALQTTVICPVTDDGGGETIQITANRSNSHMQGDQVADLLLQTVLVRLVGPSSMALASPVRLSWLEYRPADEVTAYPTALSADPWADIVPSSVCLTACPGLGCISPSLWCDGVADCPDGADELPTACTGAGASLFSLRLVLLGLAVGGAGVFTLLIVVLATRLRMRVQQLRADRLLKQHEETEAVLKRASNGTMETMLNHKEEVS